MKKIGIITIYGENNYGNRLQNYAMKKIIENAGGQADTLILTNNIKEWVSKRLLHKIGLWSTVLYFMCGRKGTLGSYRQRYHAFRAFTRLYIPTLYFGRRAQKHLADTYDYFFIGSDQVWRPGSYAHSYDFADFARPEQKVPVAPSFGISSLTEQQSSYMRHYLGSFERFSVREQRGAELIRQLTGKDATVLVDPTLMLSREEWQSIETEVPGIDGSSGYILTYFLEEKDPSVHDEIRSLADIRGLKIHNLCDLSEPELYKVGPSGFLWLVDHASLVCTDSFHATVFSIIFDRPCRTYQRGIDMGGRIESLLRTLGIEGQTSTEKPFEQAFSCNYSEAYVRVKSEQELFIRYLRNAVPELNWESRSW